MKKLILIICLIGMFLLTGCIRPAGTEKMIGPEKQFSVYGKLSDFSFNNNLLNLVIDGEIYDCKRNSSEIKITVELQDYELKNIEVLDNGINGWGDKSLLKGEKYLFYFEKYPFDKHWRLNPFKEDYTECASYHDSDIFIEQKIEEIEFMDESSYRITPNLVHSERTTIPITSKIELFIVDGRAYNIFLFGKRDIDPITSKTLKDAIIDECTIDYPMGEIKVDVNEKVGLPIIVKCKKPYKELNCIKTARVCYDMHETNCGDKTYENCDLNLLGYIEFTDELGFKHKMPTFFRQSLFEIVNRAVEE